MFNKTFGKKFCMQIVKFCTKVSVIWKTRRYCFKSKNLNKIEINIFMHNPEKLFLNSVEHFLEKFASRKFLRIFIIK